MKGLFSMILSHWPFKATIHTQFPICSAFESMSIAIMHGSVTEQETLNWLQGFGPRHSVEYSQNETAVVVRYRGSIGNVMKAKGWEHTSRALFAHRFWNITEKDIESLLEHKK